MYDIVKAHGGVPTGIKVETKEGKGSEFVISLPVVESRLPDYVIQAGIIKIKGLHRSIVLQMKK